MYLNLSETWIRGKVPSNIINLQGLEVLDLMHTELEGIVVSKMGSFMNYKFCVLVEITLKAKCHYPSF